MSNEQTFLHLSIDSAENIISGQLKLNLHTILYMIRNYHTFEQSCNYFMFALLFKVLTILMVKMVGYFLFCKMFKIGKNYHHNFLEPKFLSSNCIFCPKPKDVSYTFRKDKEKQQFLTFNKFGSSSI